MNTLHYNAYSKSFTLFKLQCDTQTIKHLCDIDETEC